MNQGPSNDLRAQPELEALDARHLAAAAAFSRKDIAAYQDIFSPNLSYRRLSGAVVDRGQLMRDVASQFRRLNWARSSYRRESLELADGGAVETLTQTAGLGATAYLVIHRSWTLRRRGLYTWSRADGVWRIEAVEILEEQLTSNGFHFGLNPAPG